MLFAAGCGGGSPATTHTSAPPPEAQTRQELPAIEAQFKQAANAIGAAIVRAPRQNNFQIASSFSALAAKWQVPLGRLQTLTAPAKARAEFATLVRAATQAEADLRALSTAARAGNASAARKASAGLVRSIEQAQGASTRIDGALGLP